MSEVQTVERYSDDVAQDVAERLVHPVKFALKGHRKTFWRYLRRPLLGWLIVITAVLAVNLIAWLFGYTEPGSPVRETLYECAQRTGTYDCIPTLVPGEPVTIWGGLDQLSSAKGYPADDAHDGAFISLPFKGTLIVGLAATLLGALLLPAWWLRNVMYDLLASLRYKMYLKRGRIKRIDVPTGYLFHWENAVDKWGVELTGIGGTLPAWDTVLADNFDIVDDTRDLVEALEDSNLSSLDREKGEAVVSAAMHNLIGRLVGTQLEANHLAAAKAQANSKLIRDRFDELLR